MIGNDVVNLPQSRIESNWLRKGFIEKIFTPDEQLLITNSADPEIMVWLLWSMKEAAYKIYNRQTKIREYIPLKLLCKIISQNGNCFLGQVLCMNAVFPTKTTILEHNIHTIAATSVRNLARIIEIKNKDIVKDEFGIPYLKRKKFDSLQDVSVSHHGDYEKIVTILH
ncbi:4'-phosphopantetheinyl transferase family protein [Flavobacterium poyangense]|uniref:4'-phosphopantetheinyl transferase family protein n=1 Tax=Flavobacterium poyangense TaxID=2204302 RepID=UPI001421F9B6|nr:4'-phosphopantetheinyl transferase superfamily protein [Flavobacterium sp. JXAS1]